MISMNDGYLGYTDDMAPYSKARVERILDKRWRYNGEGDFCQKDYLLKAAIEGRVSETLMESHSYYAGHLEYKQTKPKRVYRLYNLGSDNVFLELKKTEYDFYEWLRAEGLTTEEAVRVRLEEQERAAEEAENMRKEAECAARRKEEERAQQEEAADVLVYASAQHLTQEEKLLMDEVWMGTAGVTPADYTLLGEIHNFDNPICKERICSTLYNSNKASIKVFEHMTGLTLPKAYKERVEYLNSITSADFRGMQPCKPRGKLRGESVFYISCYMNGEIVWRKVYAAPVDICGFACFVFRQGSMWNVSHVDSGFCVRRGKNRAEAIRLAEEWLSRASSERAIEKVTKSVVDKIGRSPSSTRA